VTGPGKTECLVEFLAGIPRLRLAWIENEFHLYPHGFLQRNLSLQNTLFVEAGTEYVWATLQIVSSALFDVTVLSLPFQKLKPLSDLRTVRRLQLAAEKSKCSLILLSDEALEAWPVALHLRSSRTDGPPHWQTVRSRL
jgi:hypothetical protein